MSEKNFEIEGVGPQPRVAAVWREKSGGGAGEYKHRAAELPFLGWVGQRVGDVEEAEMPADALASARM